MGDEAVSFGEFTEAGFRALISSLIAAGYRFASYGDAGEDRHVLWRHDVDVSMHRAVRLAEIEAEVGVHATYFVNPRCTFYNLLESGIIRLVHRIHNLGHEIGLHFDGGIDEGTNWTIDRLDQAVSHERALVEQAVGASVRSVSWHNPTMSNLLAFDQKHIAGLTSAYGATLRENYAYCSDSNGYWRFKPMADVISEGHRRLHLLTHPEWWTPEAMSPSARIDRAILGRARAVRRDYDVMLKTAGRVNRD